MTLTAYGVKNVFGCVGGDKGGVHLRPSTRYFRNGRYVCCLCLLGVTKPPYTVSIIYIYGYPYINIILVYIIHRLNLPIFVLETPYTSDPITSQLP